VVRLLPDQNSGIALALNARIIFHRMNSMQELGTCDAALLQRYLDMRQSHFLERWYVCCSFYSALKVSILSSDFLLKRPRYAEASWCILGCQQVHARCMMYHRMPDECAVLLRPMIPSFP
jgi:hypothetical protein